MSSSLPVSACFHSSSTQSLLAAERPLCFFFLHCQPSSLVPQLLFTLALCSGGKKIRRNHALHLLYHCLWSLSLCFLLRSGEVNRLELFLNSFFVASKGTHLLSPGKCVVQLLSLSSNKYRKVIIRVLYKGGVLIQTNPLPIHVKKYIHLIKYLPTLVTYIQKEAEWTSTSHIAAHAKS